jgi:hypothetical protein
MLLPLALTACFTEEPPLEPADCGTSARTYKVDRIEMPRSNTESREMGIDLNGDAIVDNQLGMVTSTLRGFFSEAAFDLETRAAEHFASDTDWRVSVWECPADQRLVALTAGADEPTVADLRGGLQGPLFTATGRSGFVPLGALFDADGSGGPTFVDAETAAIRLEDPGEEELDAVLASGIEGALASTVIVSAMTPFVDANLTYGRDEIDADGDGTITETELGRASLVQSLLAPDLTVGDVDALSFGIRIRATRVR